MIRLDTGEVVDYETFKASESVFVRIDPATLLRMAIAGTPTPRRVHRACEHTTVSRHSLVAVRPMLEGTDTQDAETVAEVSVALVAIIDRELTACRRARPSRDDRRAAERHGRQRCRPDASPRRSADAPQVPPGQLVTARPACALAPPPPCAALLSDGVAVGIAS